MRGSWSTSRMQLAFYALGIIFLSCVHISPSEGSRILLTPFPFGSHIHHLLTIGEGLIDRGHEVYATSSPTFPDLHKYQKGRVKFILYEAAEPEWYELISDVDMKDFIVENPPKEEFRTEMPGIVEMVTNPLKDQKFFQELKSMNFDLAVVDTFPGGLWMLVLMHRLGLPYVSSETFYESWLLRNPSLPSAWPSNINTPYTDIMTFWERVNNLWDTIDWFAYTGVRSLEDEFLKDYFFDTDPVPLRRLAAKSVLWFIDHSTVLDYPRPQMPNEIHIGGLSTKAAKPLPADLEKFMSSNPAGVIVVSFGSLSLNLPQPVVKELLDAFNQVKYNVIMRLPMDLHLDIPKHVKLISWLPQNDLLGHKNTKLFITHCGAGGQYEALYHGIPMIGLPMFGDQPYNAKRMVYHGFGLSLTLKSVTSADLTRAINEVISNQTYSANIAWASTIFKDQPMTPRERAVYWIEHVIKHGGEHLHSYALDMPWYQYLMLDILAFLLGIFLVAVVMLSCVLRIVYTNVRRIGVKSKKE